MRWPFTKQNGEKRFMELALKIWLIGFIGVVLLLIELSVKI